MNAHNGFDDSYDVPIMTPNEATEHFNDPMIIVSVQGEFDNICNSLKNIGFKSAQFVPYKFKGDFYFQVLDESFSRIEEEDRMKRNGIV